MSKSITSAAERKAAVNTRQVRPFNSTISRSREIVPFTSIRGVAAWVIVIYHLRGTPLIGATAYQMISHGDVAVDLFFIMSGFLISLRYGEAFSRMLRRSDWALFIGLRLARIYPLHAVMLCLYLLLPAAYLSSGRQMPSQNYGVEYFIGSIFLVQNWGEFSYLHWNIPAWSISTEFLFYLLFPLTASLLSRATRNWVGLVGAGLVLVAALFVLGKTSGGLTRNIASFGTPRCLLECSLGVWLLHASRRFPPGVAMAWCLMAGAALAAACWFLGLLPDTIAVPVAFTGLLWAVLEPSNAISAILSHPKLRWLGELSFATYMVHYWLRDVMKLFLPLPLSSMPLLAIYCLVVLVASVALYRWVELPGRSAGRRWAYRALHPPSDFGLEAEPVNVR